MEQMETSGEVCRPVGGTPDVSLNEPTMYKTSFFPPLCSSKITTKLRHSTWKFLQPAPEPSISVTLRTDTLPPHKNHTFLMRTRFFPHNRHIHGATNSEAKVELISQLGSTNGSLGARREKRRPTQRTRLKLDAKLIGVLIGAGRVARPMRNNYIFI